MATLRLLYHYYEGLASTTGVNSALRLPAFQTLLVNLHLSSSMVQSSSFSVLSLYYETVLRYDDLFQGTELPTVGNGNALLARLLETMTGLQGLQNADLRVRSRCCHLLPRLIKSSIRLLRPYTESVIEGVQGFVMRVAEASHNSAANRLLLSDDVLKLFDAMGLLLGMTN